MCMKQLINDQEEKKINAESVEKAIIKEKHFTTMLIKNCGGLLLPCPTDGTVCYICQDDMVNQDHVVVQCKNGHFAHSVCVGDGIASGIVTCGVCRVNIAPGVSEHDMSPSYSPSRTPTLSPHVPYDPTPTNPPYLQI